MPSVIWLCGGRQPRLMHGSLMSATALLLTRDRHVFTTLLPLLEAAELKVEGCFAPGEAMLQLKVKKFDAVLIDCASVPDANDIIEALRHGKSNRRAVAFAITEDPHDSQQAFKAGANFVIEKPIQAERAVRSLRAALGLILRERRRYFRCPLNASLTLQQGEAHEFQWSIDNVSEGGLGAVVPEYSTRVGAASVFISFKLPQTGQLIAGKADIVWTRQGKAGLQFQALRPESRVELDRYLAKRFEENDRLQMGRRAARAR